MSKLALGGMASLFACGVAMGTEDEWTALVRKFRGITHLSAEFQRFFLYECPEPEGYLHNCFQNMIYLNDESLEFAYSDYTPRQVVYPKGSRPYLEKVVESVFGDAKDDVTKLGRLVAWTHSFRPIPEYHGPLPMIVTEEKDVDDLYYRNPEEWLIIFGRGDCAAKARTFVTLAQIAGFPARIVQLQNHHTIAEVYVNDQWALYDPERGLMPLTKDGGRPMTVWQVHKGSPLAWGRLGAPLTGDDADRASNLNVDEKTKSWFGEVCVGNYGYVPWNRREALPFFGVTPAEAKEKVDLKALLADPKATKRPGPWTIGLWKEGTYREDEYLPEFTPIEGARFSGRGAISVELLGRYGTRNTVGLLFGGKGPAECFGLILYEGYGVKLIQCKNGAYTDLAVADYPTVPWKPYTLGIVADGKKIHGYVNGQHLFEVEGAVKAGPVGFFNCVEARATWRNLVVSGEK